MGASDGCMIHSHSLRGHRTQAARSVLCPAGPATLAWPGSLPPHTAHTAPLQPCSVVAQKGIHVGQAGVHTLLSLHSPHLQPPRQHGEGEGKDKAPLRPLQECEPLLPTEQLPVATRPAQMGRPEMEPFVLGWPGGAEKQRGHCSSCHCP